MHLARYEEAEAELGKAISLDLGDVAAHEALAQILEVQGRVEDALVEHRQVSRLAPEDGARRLTAGEAFLRLVTKARPAPNATRREPGGLRGSASCDK